MKEILPSDVLLRPILNEKSLLMREKFQFFFEVHFSANKNLVMKAMFLTFGVLPVSCNMKVMKKNRKKSSMGGNRSSVRKVSFSRKKIAMVTFPVGTEIQELSV